MAAVNSAAEPLATLQGLAQNVQAKFNELSGNINTALENARLGLLHQPVPSTSQPCHLALIPAKPSSRIFRMPLPFASITDPSPLSVSKPAQPQPSAQPAGSWSEPGSESESEVNWQDLDDRILISEVEVTGVEGDLKRIAEEAMAVRPNYAYTAKEVHRDVQKVFKTGWFNSVQPDAVDTRDGVKLILKVRPNEEFRGLSAAGASALPTVVVQKAFEDMQGKPLNLLHLKQAVRQVNQWYEDKGVVGQVAFYEFKDGRLNLGVSEAVVNNVELRFLDAKTKEPKEKVRTKPHIITRHLTTKPGQVYNIKAAQRDIDAVYSTGLFEDVNITLDEAAQNEEEDPDGLFPKVNVKLNMVERKTRGYNFGGGISPASTSEGALPGLVGTFSLNDRNLFGLNQRLSIAADLGQVDRLFRIEHTDPWVDSDAARTSRTIQLMNNRTSGNAIHGRVEAEGEEEPAAGGGVLLGRLTSSVDFERPLAPCWIGGFRTDWQRTRCMNEKGLPVTRDAYGSPLTFSSSNSDTMFVATISTAYNNPEDASQFAFSLEQAAPVRREWLNFTRLKLKVERPLRLGPVELALRGRAGFVRGDLPPYEAFAIGGTNSVRGYGEGGVGSGRHCIEGSAELRLKLPVQALTGTMFVDYGTDLNSGASVIGDPAGVRNKPGTGYGYGLGVRVDSPVGPLRVEYAWNEKRVGRFHIGLGYVS